MLGIYIITIKEYLYIQQLILENASMAHFQENSLKGENKTTYRTVNKIVMSCYAVNYYIIIVIYSFIVIISLLCAFI